MSATSSPGLQDIRFGETVLVDISYGVTPETFALKVVSVSKKRFVARGPGKQGSIWTMTFRKEDGRSVGERTTKWARRASTP